MTQKVGTELVVRAIAFGAVGEEATPVDASHPLPVVLTASDIEASGIATEAKQDTGNTSLASIDTKMSTLAGYVDGLEALITTLNGYADGLETLLGTGNTSTAAIGTLITTLNTYADGLETLIGSTNTLLTTQAGYLDGLEGFVDGLEGVLGTTAGAAVITDANGSIQQYLRGIIVKMIAQLPASLGIKTAANSLSIAPASDASFAVTGPQTNAEFIAALKAATATHSSVNSGTSSVTILASNGNRKGGTIFNTDANNLFLDLSGGTAVAATRAQKKLAQNEGCEIPAGYTGAITGIWSADGSGVASVVEFTV